jgi:Domain of unknown function (DUF5668)
MIDVTPIPPSPPPLPSGRPSRSRLLPGVALMLLGGYLLADNLGFSLPYSIFNALPLVFIGAGVIGLSFPSRHLPRSKGAWLLGIGLYLACGMFHLFGLGWGTAWPIFIIGAGLAIILSRDRLGDGLCNRQARGGFR